MSRSFPQGLAARFSLLLTAALLGGNLIAAILFAREGTSFDRAIRLQGDAHRLAALVEMLETSDPETARMLPAHSSTGFTRFSVDPAPLALVGTQRLPVHESDLAIELPYREIQIREGAHSGDTGARDPLLLVSVRLDQGVEAGNWLNALAYPLPSHRAWKWKIGFFAPLIASLIGTLAVGLLFIRRMTQPLRALAEAARVAGQGNRRARVTECGAIEFRNAAFAFNDMQRRIGEFEVERLRMLAALGHDLRTPITSLRIRAELLDDDTQREEMVRVLDEMAVMTEDLLHAAAAGASREPVQDGDLDALLAQLCAERGLSYSGAPGMELGLRPVAMRRAIGNLLDNAQRYAGGARVRLRRGPAAALIWIEDDGPGIEEDILRRVTEPFVRGEASRSSESGGVGLGLSIAQDIIRSHGGVLVLSNRNPHGLRAEIRLPLDASAAGSPVAVVQTGQHSPEPSAPDCALSH